MVRKSLEWLVLLCVFVVPAPSSPSEAVRFFAAYAVLAAVWSLLHWKR